MLKSKYQFITIFEALKNQHLFLKNNSKNVINKLNQIYTDYGKIEDKFSPIALLFHNLGEHNEFDISLKIITPELEIKPLYEYDINLNDGNSYGIGKFEDYISKYPIEDYFSIARSEFLNRMLFEFFLECLWNSKLLKLNTELIFSDTTSCDTFINLKDGLTEYQSLDYLIKK